MATVAESFFAPLKRERIRRRTYKTRAEARQGVFDDVEMLYNPVRKQVRNGMPPSVEFERRRILKAGSVWKTRCYSKSTRLAPYAKPALHTWRRHLSCRCRWPAGARLTLDKTSDFVSKI